VAHRVRALAVLVLAAACGGKVSGGAGQDDGGQGSSSSGGSGGSSGSSSGGDNSCLETSGSPPACISCIESQCGAQLSAVESGCSDLLNCECPGGVYNATAAQSCSAPGQQASCTGPAAQIDQCVTENCQSQCDTGSSGGGGSSSSGGVSSSGGSSSGGPPPVGCTVDDTISCTGGADGYACAAGDNPEAENSSLSCSTPIASADGEDDYCCFAGFTGNSSNCEQDDDLASVCPDPDSYGYQCDAGDDPTSYDSQLNCSPNTPDPDGVHDDFCCTYD